MRPDQGVYLNRLRCPADRSRIVIESIKRKSLRNDSVTS
jgi:hypothetical protein